MVFERLRSNGWGASLLLGTLGKAELPGRGLVEFDLRGIVDMFTAMEDLMWKLSDVSSNLKRRK